MNTCNGEDEEQDSCVSSHLQLKKIRSHQIQTRIQDSVPHTNISEIIKDINDILKKCLRAVNQIYI